LEVFRVTEIESEVDKFTNKNDKFKMNPKWRTENEIYQFSLLDYE